MKIEIKYRENDPESVCTVCSFIPCCLTSCDELIFHLDLDFGSRLSKGVSQPRVAFEQLTTQPGGLVVVVFSWLTASVHNP